MRIVEHSRHARPPCWIELRNVLGQHAQVAQGRLQARVSQDGLEGAEIDAHLEEKNSEHRK